MANYIGTSGWSYSHWQGLFYPQELSKGRWLEFYMQHFDTVELNASFYRLPKKKTFENWRARTPKDFVFSVKMSRYVSHIKRLLDPEESLPRFFESVSALKEKCGPILIQLPPSMKFNEERVINFLEVLTQTHKGYRFTMECRNESWFLDQVYALLKQYGVALCLADTPKYPYVEEITSDFIYIRLHGHEQLYTSNYSDQQLEDWGMKIREWNQEGMDVYVYFDNDANAYAPRNALDLKEILYQ
jgi:uncharacterized protein YecE (DUF72 family)